MAVPDPPFSSPRIVKVLQPSAGQYEVIVRMDPTLAAKFPDKPFGTAISAIGLATKDAAKFSGYTLVAIEPADRGGKDHLWVFQKLPGPITTGRQAYVERTLATVTEQQVAPGTEVDSGLLIVQSSVKPDGLGKSVKDVVSVASWPLHTEVDWNNDLLGHVTRTEQYVAPSEAASPTSHASYKIVNKDRSLKVTEVVPTTSLNNFVLRYPKKISLDLPRVLKSIAVVWNEGSDIGQRDNYFYNVSSGESYSISGDNDDTDKSSVSLSPEVQIEWEDYSANNLMGEVAVFYLPMTPAITEAIILAKLTALLGAAVIKWPVFKTRSSTLSLLGQSASVSVSTNASMSRTISDSVVTASRLQYGHGDNISKNLTNGAVQIPPCIHGLITVTGTTTRTESVSALATSPIAISGQIGGDIALYPLHTRTIEVNGSVSPTSLAATEPAAVPTSGLYLTDMSVQPWEYGYAKVYAEVFDSANLA